MVVIVIIVVVIVVTVVIVIIVILVIVIDVALCCYLWLQSGRTANLKSLGGRAAPLAWPRPFRAAPAVHELRGLPRVELPVASGAARCCSWCSAGRGGGGARARGPVDGRPVHQRHRCEVAGPGLSALPIGLQEEAVERSRLAA